jgi:pilus assembly protein CpaE
MVKKTRYMNNWGVNMKTSTQIILATQEAGFAEKFGQVLRSNHSDSQLSTCQGVSELQNRLEKTPAPIAIVDIDSSPREMLKEIDHLVTLFPETRFAVASSISSQEIILEAMEAGARHFMSKGSIQPELDRLMEKMLVDEDKTGAALGQIITVFSAGGGCGATTVCLNLANELRLQTSGPVLTIDLDNCYGAVSSYLGITGKYSITDVLKQKERIDSDLITTSAASYRANFDVLVNPASIPENGSADGLYTHLAKALEACRGAYKYTIIDAPRVSGQMMRLLAGASKAVLVVFQANVKDIKITRKILASLKEFHVNSDNVIPLVSRFNRWLFQVPSEQIKKAVGTEQLHMVRNSFRKIINCVNSGQTLSESAPRSGIRRDFQQLAKSISGCNGRDK